MEQTRVFRSIYVSQLIAVGLEVGQATHDSLCERALYDQPLDEQLVEFRQPIYVKLPFIYVLDHAFLPCAIMLEYAMSFCGLSLTYVQLYLVYLWFMDVLFIFWEFIDVVFPHASSIDQLRWSFQAFIHALQALNVFYCETLPYEMSPTFIRYVSFHVSLL